MKNYNYLKQTIGLLIKYYRKQSSFPLNYYLETNDDFIRNNCPKCNQCANPQKICSKNTLYRIEEGQIISNECVYHRLADKFNKTVVLNQITIYDKLENYRIQLELNLVDFSKRQLEILCEQIESDINKYQNVLYIYEILLFYKLLIQDRLIHYKVSKDNIDLILYLKNIVSEENKKLIVYYLSVGSFKHGNFGVDAKAIDEESKKYINDPLFYIVKLNNICVKNNLVAYREIMNTEMPNFHLLTPFQKHLLYSSLEFILVNSENCEEAYEALIDHLEIIKRSDFGNITLKTCYLRLGIVTYASKRYEETIKWLLKAFEINHSLGKDLALLCSALEKNNKKEIILKVINDTDITQTKSAYGKELYSYYKLKHEKQDLSKNDLIRLEDFICNTLKPYANQMGSLHKNIFDEDLRTYVKTTRNFKKYFDYNL